MNEYLITIEQLEVIGEMVDKASNLAAASKMKVSPHIHIEGMRGGLEDIEKVLRELYIAVSGDNPWDD
jgi:hypothetical protein